MPKRRDVLQVTLPTSTLKTVEYVVDPNNLMTKVESGSLYHGINSLPKVVSSFGYQNIFRFKDRIDPVSIGNTYQEAVESSKVAEDRADKLMGKITVK